ncbi:MAG TPA: polysaccharide biosynthesis/export family protein [Polyangia bacterium]|nr:polysaccharide biosynthesis/export family protein [Polyangia bacterium]
MRSLLLVGCVLAAGCGPVASTTVEQSPLMQVADSTLGIGDTFEVRVYGEPDLTGVYKVGAEGTINFPLAGSIKVDGLDPQQVSKVIAEKLSDGILRNPQVSVLVREQTSKKVYILGQVSKPGTFTYTPSMNVVEAITQAGGFTALAAKNDTTLTTRNESGQKVTLRVPVEDIGRGRAKNVFLRPGDIINVPERLF